MSWQEPGRDRDPWDGGSGGGGDLDDMLRRLRQRLGRWLGRRPGGPPRKNAVRIGWLAPLVLIGIWLLTGFYQVASGSKGVRVEFGALAGLSGPGVHWHWPWPIERVYVVDVAEPRSVSQRQTVLTRDAQLATLEMTVRYRIADPYEYLFGVDNAATTLSALAADAIASAARNHTLAELSGSDRSAIESSLEGEIGRSLKTMHTGLDLSAVSITRVGLPQAVTKAQNQLAAERESAAAAATAARTAAVDGLARAHMRARETVAAARAEAAGRVARARAEVAAFRELLPAWRADPAMTREMLREYAISDILGSAAKVVVVGPIHSVSIPSWPATSPATTMAPAQSTAKKAHGGKH